jgi:hypothetical protein
MCKANNMRFFLIILTGFLALGSSHIPHIPINKDLSILPTTHLDTTKGVIIQNSFPKGNGRLDATEKNGYNDPGGKNFAYSIFWTRVINETAAPLELTISFPADSFEVTRSPHSYIKFFIPPDTMTMDKESLYDYGLTGLKSFLDTSFNKPTILQRTINPKEDCLFYIVRLANLGYDVLCGRDLFYRDENFFIK